MNQLSFNKNLILILSGIITFLAVACQQSGSGGGSTPPPPVPIACPNGQVGYNGTCILPIVGGNGQLQYYTSKSDPVSNIDSLTPDTSYVDFLKGALGVCERCATSIGEALKCSSWQNGFNMIRLEFTPGNMTQLKVHFQTTPKLSNPYFQYAWSFPKIGDFFLALLGAPMPSCNYGQQTPYWFGTFNLQANTSSSGFVVYGQGPLGSEWNRHAIRFNITNGNVGDSSFNYSMIAITPDNTQINLAHGKFQLCQTPNCGVF